MIKTKYKITAPKKTWKSILLSLKLYPGHCFHFCSNTGGGIIARWAPTGEDEGIHQETWRMKISGRLEKHFPKRITLSLKRHPVENPILDLRGSNVFEMEDSEEWIEGLLDQGITPELRFDYNTGNLSRFIP